MLAFFIILMIKLLLYIIFCIIFPAERSCRSRTIKKILLNQNDKITFQKSEILKSLI